MSMSLLVNKRIRFDYEILEKVEAGLDLFGFEVKTLRAGRGSLKGAHIIIRGNEGFLVGANIPAYQQANAPKDFDPKRPRRLLLSQKEIAHLTGSEKQKGLTIVPLSVYNKGRFLKMETAIVRGKKQHDKRETLKKRDDERTMRRSLKRE